MKIIIDTKNDTVKVGSKTFSELNDAKKTGIENYIRDFLCKNTDLTDYEEDSMWMSYRYCIGRHTIASHMHAGDIWKHCKGRMSKERQLFTAFDINREIERCLTFRNPYFYFPITSLNKIYTSAVDIVCEFMEEYNINSIDDFLKYRDVHIILADNDRGYKIETTTWEEWFRPQVLKICRRFYDNDAMSEDFAWKNFQSWMDNEDDYGKLGEKFTELTKDMPNPEHYYMHDFEDLFVWNDLVHCFDYEHHHKSILTDGLEVEWFWSWKEKTEKKEDGNYYKTFGYERIRIPLEKWRGNSFTTWIPDSSIKEDIY